MAWLDLIACWPVCRAPVCVLCSSLARTHLFFPVFGEVNGKTGTPIYATLFVMIATLPLSILTDLPPLIDMVSAGEFGGMVCKACPLIRKGGGHVAKVVQRRAASFSIIET